MSILLLNSSARLEASNSRAVADYLVEKLIEKEGSDYDGRILHRDLVKQPLPPITAEDLVGVHGSLEEGASNSLMEHLKVSEELIGELKQVDTIVFAVSMYNFSVPSYLKQWIDYVCRAGVTFRYGENGPEGLTGVKRAFIVTASGGTTIGGVGDFASTYVEHICRFLGIDEIYQIDASGSKRKPEEVITNAKALVDGVVV